MALDHGIYPSCYTLARVADPVFSSTRMEPLAERFERDLAAFLERTGLMPSEFGRRAGADFHSRRRATVEEQWARSLRFLSTELTNAGFTSDGAAMAAGTADTELQVEQVVLRIHPAPEAPHGATADFDLVHLRDGQDILRERWSLTLRFTFLDAIPSELVVYNPMGLLITYLQADRTLVTEAPA